MGTIGGRDPSRGTSGDQRAPETSETADQPTDEDA
jgi:hypothetical protein